MAGKGRFNIPSLDEMGKAPAVTFQATDLMAAHKEDQKKKQEDATAGDSKEVKTSTTTSISTVINQTKAAAAAANVHPTERAKTIIQNKQGSNIVPSSKVSGGHDSSGETVQKVPQESIGSKVPSKPSTVMYKPITVMERKDDRAEIKPSGNGGTGSPTKLGKTSILVSPRQRGNPILKFVRNVAWEFDDIVPDYQLSKTSCALFLSLRYHQLNPNYIHERLKQLGHSYDLRLMLTLIDMKDPHHCLKELAKVCILADTTLIVAFSPEEAGRYLETYKAFENKPPDLIMEKTEGTFLSKFTDSITSVKKVNKTDAMTLLSTFGTFENIVNATEEDLSLCSGFGPQKANKLHAALKEPFLKPTKRKATKDKNGEASDTIKKPSESPKKT